MKEIEVVRGAKLQAGYSTRGIVREKAFESYHRYVVVSRTTAAGGAVSGWHHHGTRHLYGFHVAGRIRLEYGPRGKRAVEAEEDDFFHIPPRLVHRDLNPDKKHEFVVVNILVGRGAPVINVDGPLNPGGRRKPRRTAR